jgi:hypothetical protein
LLFWLSKARAALTKSEELINDCQRKGQQEDLFLNQELIEVFLETTTRSNFSKIVVGKLGLKMIQAT